MSWYVVYDNRHVCLDKWLFLHSQKAEDALSDWYLYHSTSTKNKQNFSCCKPQDSDICDPPFASSDALSGSYLFCFHLEGKHSKEEVLGRNLWNTTSPRLKQCCSISSPELTPSTNQSLQKAQDLSLEKLWKKLSVTALALRSSRFLFFQDFLFCLRDFHMKDGHLCP